MTAAELLSMSAFLDGKYAQAFPSFGSERTGAPVIAFCRISDSPIRTREPVNAPNVLLLQDSTLLHQMDIFGGLSPQGQVLINSSRTLEELHLDEMMAKQPATAHVHASRLRDGDTTSGPSDSQRSSGRWLCRDDGSRK